jgi:hypothetical protein
MNLTKQKLLEMIEEELDEGMLATAALTGFLSLSPAFTKALKVVQTTKPGQARVMPKGVDSDTVAALFTLKKNGQLGNAKALQQLDKRTRKGLETPDEHKE